MERKYIVQRIEWVTTGWKGPCRLEDKKKCEMKYPENRRKQSKKEGRTVCKGCGECYAFKKWRWGFVPPKLRPKELNKGDVVLIISRNKKEDPNYYCIGVGVVRKYDRDEDLVIYDPNLSVSFFVPKEPIKKPTAGHIKYPKNYPKTGRVCFTYIKENQAIKLLELAKEQHEKINEPEIAKRIEKLIKFIKNTSEKDYQNLEGIKKILNAINTKPFIILSGISGTGKTQIARLISAGIVKFKGG